MIHMAKPQIGEEEKQAVMEVLDSGIIAQGPRVKAFEEGFAEMCGTKFAVATSSGTTALHVALLAHGIGAGDEVMVGRRGRDAHVPTGRSAEAISLFVPV